MNQMNNELGRHIITNEMGIGVVKEIVDMGEQGNFFRVLFDKASGTHFFSTTNTKNYRLIESKENLQDAITVFKENKLNKKFDTIKDMINFYKVALQANEVFVLAQALGNLNQQKEIHTSLKRQFNDSLSNFVKEIEFVYEIKNIEAWRMLGLNKNNK